MPSVRSISRTRRENNGIDLCEQVGSIRRRPCAADFEVRAHRERGPNDEFAMPRGGCSGDAIRRPSGSTGPARVPAAQAREARARCDQATDGNGSCGSNRSSSRECERDAALPARSRGPGSHAGSSRSAARSTDSAMGCVARFSLPRHPGSQCDPERPGPSCSETMSKPTVARKVEGVEYLAQFSNVLDWLIVRKLCPSPGDRE